MKREEIKAIPPVSAFGEIPAVRFTVALIAGALCGRHFFEVFRHYMPLLGIAAGVCALLLVAMALCGRRNAGNRRWVIDFAFFTFTVLFFFLVSLMHTVHSLHRSTFAWSTQKAVYAGIVEETPKPGNKVLRMKIKVLETYGNENGRGSGKATGVGASAMVSFMRSPAVDTLEAGDAVAFYARMEKPRSTGNPYTFDYASYLETHGVGGEAFVFRDGVLPLPEEQRCRLSQGLSLYNRLLVAGCRVRGMLSQKLRSAGVGGEAFGAVAAMTLGNKTALSKAVRDVFAHTGTSHILALSGLHLAIVYSLLQFVLTGGRRVKRMRIPAHVVSVGFIWAYAFVAGMPQSLVRASLMYTLLSLGAVWQRESVSLSNLWFAAFAMLFVSPLSLYDVGFQLSFVSVFFILAFARLLAPPKLVMGRPVGKIWSMIAVSLCAQVGVAPLVAYHFHTFPTWFVFSNLIVVPLTTFVVQGGVVLLAVSWCQPLASAVGWVLNIVVGFMIKFLGFMGNLPFAVIGLYPSAGTVLLLYVALLLVYMYSRQRRAMLLVYAGFPLLAAVAWQTLSWRAARARVPGVYFYKHLSVSAVQFVASPMESYVYSPQQFCDSVVTAAMAGVKNDFWNRLDMASPRRLPTHYASGAVRRRGRIVAFAGRTFMMLDDTVRISPPPVKTSVDVVFVAGGFRGNAAEWLSAVCPRLLVVDSRLSEYRRGSFVAECRRRGIALCDLSTSPALKLGVRR
jgi:competence protein ComEC